jgi:hypothetical protein
MALLVSLWLPILLSAVFVFIASSIIHVALPIHKGDFKKLPGEEKVLEAMRTAGVQPGAYGFPFLESMKDMGSPEMTEKYKKGPVGFMTVIPSGTPGMGKNLVMWFLYTILIGIFVGYVACLALGRGADYRAVFRVTGTVAILAYAIPYIADSIWKSQSWSTTFRFMFGGVVYGLATAGTFGWLWPE